MLRLHMDCPTPILAGLLSTWNGLSVWFCHIIWCDLTELPRDLFHVCCRNFKGIIRTLLWESNDHLLTVVEVKIATHRPVCAPLPAAGRTSPAASTFCILLIMALWVKLRKGDSSPHDYSYPASVHLCSILHPRN